MVNEVSLEAVNGAAELVRIADALTQMNVTVKRIGMLLLIGGIVYTAKQAYDRYLVTKAFDFTGNTVD